MNTKHSFLTRCVSVLMVATMMGCATLQVDVDVYKGPLANHEDVQVEQMAVMAIGAKPMLMQLRDELENDIRAKKGNGVRIQDESWYSSEFIEYSLTPGTLARFESLRAIRINGILGLYRDVDRNEPRLASLIKRLEAGLDAVKRFSDGSSGEVSAYHDLFLLTLDFIEYFNSGDTNLSESEIKRVTAVAAHFAMVLFRSGAMIELWDPRLTEDVEENSPPQVSKNFLGTDFKIYIIEHLNGFDSDELRKNYKKLKHEKMPKDLAALQAYAQLKRVLKMRLMQHPLEVVAGLRAVYKYVEDEGSDSLILDVADTFQTTDQIAAEISMYLEQIRLITSGSGLDAGRFKKGLETLIDEYLTNKNDTYGELAVRDQKGEMSEEGRKRANLLEASRRRLADSLVHFSDKLLRVASNENLLESEKGSGSIQSGGTGGNTGDLYVRSRDKGRSTRGSSKTDFDQYILVLQAIGNSILVQVDELRHRTAHDANQRRTKEREELAVQQAYATDPSKTVDDVLAFLKSIRPEGGKTDAQFKTDIDAQTLVQYTLEGKDKDGNVITPAPAGSKPGIEKLIADHKAAAAAALTKKKAETDARTATDWFPTGEFDEVTDALTGLEKLRAEFHLFLKMERAKTDTRTADAHNTVISANLRSVFVDASRTADEKTALTGIRTAFDDAHKKAKLVVTATGKLDIYLNQIHVELTKAIELAMAGVKATPAPAADKLTKLEADKKEVEGKIEAAKGKIKTSTTNRAKAVKVRVATKHVGDLKSKVLEQVEAIGAPQLTGASVVAAIRNVIRGARSSAASGDAPKFDDTLVLVAEFPTPLGKPLVSSKSETAQDVLNDVVALLRQQHLKAISQFGASSPQATHIAATIQEASQHQSGMVYIRPASSYLRSSYAATTLQQNQGGRWENLLDQQWVRNVPLVGAAIHNNNQGLSKDRLEIIQEIDKQFWQNINSVKVSGAGNTNYVVAKDDIGNWYVKNYSADSGPIIQGAQSLAAYSVGGAMDSDVLGRVRAARGEDVAVATMGHAGPLAQVLARYQSEFAKQTNSDLEKLAELVDAENNGEAKRIAVAIRNAWEMDEAINKQIENLGAALSGANEAHLQPLVGDLNEALVEETAAKDTIEEIKTKFGDGERAGMAPLLDEISLDIVNPKRNVPIVEAMEIEYETAAQSELAELITTLKDHLGSAEQGAKYVEGIQSIRRFHNLLVSRVGNIDFVTAITEQKTAKEAAKTGKETAIQEKTDEKNQLIQEGVGQETNPKQADIDRLTQEITALEGERDALTEEITELDTQLAAAKAAKISAGKIVTSQVRSELEALIERRDSSIGEYEDRLGFVGDAASTD